MRGFGQTVLGALLVLAAVTSSTHAHDADEERHLFSYSHFHHHFIGHWGGPLIGHGYSYHFMGSCLKATTCCQYEFLSQEFNACCARYGCCPTCESNESGCSCRRSCRYKGGICRRRGCEEGERIWWWGGGWRGRCCIRENIPVTEDCEGAGECCGIEAGTGDFFACCQKYKCCPVCSKAQCTFGNETYVDGELIRSYPERCLQLRCEVEELTEAPFYQEHIVEISPNSSCGCCTLGGKMYEEGYLLTQDDYCLAVQCVDGEWVNQGYFNADCRVCTIQDPLAAAVSFDGTVSTVSDTSCSYSAVQEGYSYNPDSYVYVDFDAHSTVSGFVDRTEHVFKDTGADPVTCPADDIQGCSFGPVTDKPKEINDVGTLALTTQLGSLTFNAILGVNQITTLYTDDTLLIFAPVSKFDELGGLCGEYNGDSADDLTIRDETVTTDAAAFVTDWKTDPNCVSTPARSMLRHHDQTSLCSGVPQETVSGFEGMCQDIISPHMNITDLAKDECLQILCICNDRDIGACEASLEEWFTTLGIVDQRKKDPLDLAIELQSAFL